MQIKILDVFIILCLFRNGNCFRVWCSGGVRVGGEEFVTDIEPGASDTSQWDSVRHQDSAQDHAAVPTDTTYQATLQHRWCRTFTLLPQHSGNHLRLLMVWIISFCYTIQKGFLEGHVQIITFRYLDLRIYIYMMYRYTGWSS